jgi:hypothetical protein
VDVEDAHGEVLGEGGLFEHVELVVVAVGEFQVVLVDRVVEDLGVDPRVVAVADVRPMRTSSGTSATMRSRHSPTIR